MFEVVNTIVLEGPPIRALSALTDLEQRKVWMSSLAKSSQQRGFAKFIHRAWRHLAGSIVRKACISELLEPCTLVRLVGLRGVLALEERFEFAGDDGGTCLVHSLIIHGLAAWLCRIDRLMDLRVELIASDERLASYLRNRVVRPRDRPASPTSEQGVVQSALRL